MNSVLISLICGFTLLFTNAGPTMNAVQEGGGELRWTNYTEGVREAAASNRKVLIDVYTDWCGWCKKMDSDTYSDKTVKDYLSTNFVLIKLNAESSTKETVDSQEVTQAQIAGAFGVNGYPTTIFLESDGHPITMAPGFMKPESFINVLKYISEDAYKKMGFQEYLESQGVQAK